MARADRRDQLLDSAQEVFAADGFGPSSMDDVADRAGVTKPVLYDHFGSKDGLLAAVIERSGLDMLVATSAAIQGLEPREALLAGLTAYFSLVDKHRGSWALLLREVAPGTAAAQVVERIRQAHVEEIAGLIDAELAQADPVRAHVYAHVVSGAAERMAAVRLIDTSTTPSQAAVLLMDVLWVGFGKLMEEER